jgi:hypothetical protein
MINFFCTVLCPATFKRHHFDIDDEEVEDEYELGVGIPTKKITERIILVDNLTMVMLK